ncbi:MAG: hypothetical protein EXS09_12635 [Gemmataceae bacterium]|nr:hypothetical protein [Gemmataceae bacterium]
MSPIRRWLLKWARTAHMYLTLFGLGLLGFFAVTGFMLNHEDWFLAPEPHRVEMKGTIPAAMMQEPDKLAIVELLRKDYGAKGALASFEIEEERFRIEFKGPGHGTEAIVERETGSLEVTHESRGSVGVMLDLHRGKASGTAWSLVIDGLCILVLIIAGTGFYLWMSLRSRGHYGLIVLALGIILGIVVYFVWVP